MIEKLNSPFLERLILSMQLDYEESNRITSIRPLVKMDQRMISEIWICKKNYYLADNLLN